MPPLKGLKFEDNPAQRSASPVRPKRRTGDPRCVLGYHDSAPSALWISSFILHCPKERVSSYTDSLLLQDFPDLLHVIEIVTGNLQRQVADAHLPTLGVHTVALPLLRGKLREHAQIGFAQQAEELQ